MRFDTVLIDGQPVAVVDDEYEVETAFSFDYEISGASLTLAIVDVDRAWFLKVRQADPDQSMIAEIMLDGLIVFTGQIPAKGVTHHRQTGQTEITIQDRFANFKNRRLTGEGWNREPAEYRLAIEVPEGATVERLTFYGLPDLYPGDQIKPAGQTGTKQRVRIASPESGVVQLEKGIKGPFPEGSIFERVNHEPRYQAAALAIDHINDRLADTGIAIEDRTTDIIFDVPVLVPFPPPRGDVPGASLLMAAAGENEVICAYQTMEPGGEMVTIGFDDPPAFSIWASNPEGIAAPYPMDWTRHRSTPPEKLIAPIFSNIMNQGLVIPRWLRQGDQLEIPPGDTFFAYDYQRFEAYELKDIESVYTLRRYSWDDVAHDWIKPETVGQFPAMRQVGGMVFDGQTDALYVAWTLNGARLDQIDRNGQQTAMPWDTGTVRYHSLTLFTERRLLFAIADQTMTARHLDTGEVIMALPVNRDILTSTLTFWNDDFYAIAIGNGTRLVSWRHIEGVWQPGIDEAILDYTATVPVLIPTRDALWIGAGGRLWQYGYRYRPLLEYADIAGQTVQDLLKNLLLIMDGVLMSSWLGEVIIYPRTASLEAGPVLDASNAKTGDMSAAWDGEYSQVTVEGAGEITATAQIFDGGDELSIECKYITSASVARAVASTVLAWRSRRRRYVDIETTERVKTPSVITVESTPYLTLSVKESLVRAGSGLEQFNVSAMEVLP